MTCARCGDTMLPTRRGARHYCPLCTTAQGQRQGGKRTRKALRVLERPSLQAVFKALPDPVADAERAYRLRVLTLAYSGDRDALLSLWDTWGLRLPLVERQTGWAPPRPRPVRAGGGKPWLEVIGA